MTHSFKESNKKFLLLQGSLGQSSHINFQLGVTRDFLKSVGNGILPSTPEVSSGEVNSRSFQSLWETVPLVELQGASVKRFQSSYSSFHLLTEGSPAPASCSELALDPEAVPEWSNSRLSRVLPLTPPDPLLPLERFSFYAAC